MLLIDPPRSAYDLNFHLLGIPVRVHPLFWAVVVLLGLGGNSDPKLMLIWVGACFVSIVVHEMGHALAARAHGWEPWITLYGLGGLASYQPTRRSPRSQILISLAGPVAGFLFAALVIAVVAAAGHEPRFDPTSRLSMPVDWNLFESRPANYLVFDLLYINIFWGLVNLLPIFPLDGGQITREVFGLFSGPDGLRQSLWLSVIIAAGLAVIALTRLGDQFLAFFFGYLAYTGYSIIRAMFGPSGGLGGYR
ncbi:MAG: site-2 protease family protein [Pirellulales bacterium]